MKRENRRRMSPGVGYIGAGNKTSVFTRRNKIPFDKIKSIYGNEMERLNTEKKLQNKPFKRLSESEKLEIRKRIKAQIQKDQTRILIIVIIAIFFIFGIIYLISN